MFARARGVLGLSTFVLGLLVLAVGGAGCARADAKRDPHTIVALEAADANEINPLFSNAYYGTVYQNLVLDTLTSVGPDFVDTPALATSWTPSRDNLHWVVRLRHGVRWSDGAPFTSTDVTWTWQAILDPKTGCPYQGQFNYIKRVVALDPYTVRFDLAQTNALFVSQALGYWIMPEHVLGRIPNAQQRTATFGEHPVGTGPYVLDHWRHDEDALFKKNPYYWGGHESIDTVDVRIVLDDQARAEAMNNGSADFDDGLGAGAYLRFAGKPNIVRMRVPDLYTRFIFINFHNKALADLSVRKAMLYGWDRASYVKGLQHGDGFVATGVVPVGIRRWYEPQVTRYPYDPAKANALLDAAGWQRGDDGIRTRNGTRLAFVLSLPNGVSSADIAAQFQADMRDVGIAIGVHLVDYATFIDETNKSNFDLAFSGWGGVPDPDEFTLLDSAQIPPNGNNDGFYSNKRIDRDVERGLATIGYEKRKPYYDDMQKVLADDPPVLFTNDEYSRIALNARVHIAPADLLPDTYVWLYIWRWKVDS